MPSKAHFPAEPDTSQAPEQDVQDVGTARKIAALITRLAGAGVSGVVGAVPTPLTTTAAGAIGAAGEGLAEKIESPEPFFSTKGLSPARIGTEAALSMVPGSSIFKGGKMLGNIVRGAGLAEVGNLARRKAATGDYLPHSLPEAGWDAASVALGGLAGVPAGLKKVATAAPAAVAGPDYSGARGLRVGLDELKKVPQGNSNPYAKNLQIEPKLIPGTPEYAAYMADKLKVDNPPAVPTPANTVAAHKALAAEQTRNPKGPIAAEIGPPVEKPSIVQMEQLHEEANKGIVKDAVATEKAQATANSMMAKDKVAAEKAYGQYEKSLADVDKAHGQANTQVGKDKVAAEKAYNAYQKGLTDVEKSQQQANTMVSKEADLAAKKKAAADIVAQKIIARDQGNLADVMEWSAKQKAQKAAAQAIEDAKLGLEPQPPTVVERTTAGEGPTKTTKTVRFEAPEVEEPNTGGGEAPQGPKPVPVETNPATKETVAKTIYSSKEAALRDAQATGATSVKEIAEPGKRSKFRVVYKDLEQAETLNRARTHLTNAGVPLDKLATLAPEDAERFFNDVKAHRVANPQASFQEGVQEASKRFGGEPPIEPPPSAPVPTTPKPKSPSGGNGAVAEEMAPIDKALVKYKRYTNWAEANAIAKATGGTVNQVGPRAYKVEFPNEPVEPVLPSVGEPPVATTKLPAPKDLPRNNFTPTTTPSGGGAAAARGNLTPEEFRRYMEIRPNGPNGGPITPEVLEEYRALHGKMNGTPAEAPVAPSVAAPAEDAGFDKFSKAVDELSAEERAAQAPPQEVPSFGVEQVGAGKEREFWVRRPGQEGLGPFKDYKTASQAMSQAQRESFNPPVPTQTEGPLTVQEFAQALSKEGQKPIAEVPYTLDGGRTSVASTSGPRETSLLDAAVPEPTPPSSAPAKLYKSPLEAAGEGYGAIKAAKAAGEKVPEEGRAIAGKAAQRINREAQAATKVFEAKAAPAVQQGLDSSATLAQMDPEAQHAALADIVSKWKSQKGAVSPELFARMGLAGAGAMAGAAMTPEDPLTGAILGGSAGMFLPSVAKALIGRSQTANLSENSMRLVADKIKDGAVEFARMLPDYQRFAYLAHPVNLPLNMWVGPYGGAIMGAIEHALTLDPRGFQALKLLMNPTNFSKRWMTAIKGEAEQLLVSAEERTEGQFAQAGPEAWKRIARVPGRGMVAGDVAARDILMEAGFSADEARKITLTANLDYPITRGLEAAKKGAQTEGGKKSFFWNMALPFYRTAANQFERGMERTPGLGIFAQNLWKDTPDPWKLQFVQQVMGGSTIGASYVLGMITPEEFGKTGIKFLNNFGGQYGVPMSMAFAAGQAAGKGKDLKGQFGAALQRLIQRDLPMPTVDPIMNTVNSGLDIAGGEPENILKHPPIPIPPALTPAPYEEAGRILGLAAAPFMDSSQAKFRPPPTPRSKARFPTTTPRSPRNSK
jgi:hypothetical protein